MSNLNIWDFMRHFIQMHWWPQLPLLLTTQTALLLTAYRLGPTSQLPANKWQGSTLVIMKWLFLFVFVNNGLWEHTQHLWSDKSKPEWRAFPTSTFEMSGDMCRTGLLASRWLLLWSSTSGSLQRPCRSGFEHDTQALWRHWLQRNLWELQQLQRAEAMPQISAARTMCPIAW